MIIEIRRYTLKPGKREAFVTFLETVNRSTLQNVGMLMFGPMRAFESKEARNAIKDAFYDGPVWNNGIEPIVMPMIQHFEASITETTDGFQGFANTSKI